MFLAKLVAGLEPVYRTQHPEVDKKFLYMKKGDGMVAVAQLHDYNEALGGGRLHKDALRRLELSTLEVYNDAAGMFTVEQFEQDGYSEGRFQANSIESPVQVKGQEASSLTGKRPAKKTPVVAGTQSVTKNIKVQLADGSVRQKEVADQMDLDQWLYDMLLFGVRMAPGQPITTALDQLIEGVPYMAVTLDEWFGTFRDPQQEELVEEGDTDYGTTRSISEVDATASKRDRMAVGPVTMPRAFNSSVPMFRRSGKLHLQVKAQVLRSPSFNRASPRTPTSPAKFM